MAFYKDILLSTHIAHYVDPIKVIKYNIYKIKLIKMAKEQESTNS